MNLFYFLSFVAVLCALLVVFSKNPVHSVLYLILTFFAIACHYAFILGAEFLAAVHVIVYAGAIMVLFLYVIMMLNLNQEQEPHKDNKLKIAATILAGMLMLILIAALKGANLVTPTTNAHLEIGQVKDLGRVLFKEYLLPFEITSILLLAALVGAVMLGKSEHKQEIK